MARYILVAHTEPVEGREAEFHDWTDNVHIPQIAALDGVDACVTQRFRMIDRPAPFRETRRYLTIYDVETNDIERVADAVDAAIAGKAFTLSDAFDGTSSSSSFFEVFTDRIAQR